MSEALNILLYKACSCTHGQKFVDTGTLYPHGIAEHLIPKVFICCYKSLYSSEKAFHKILEPSCRNLLSFSHKCVSDFGHWCDMMSQRRSGLCAELCSSTSVFLNGRGFIRCHIGIENGFPEQFLQNWNNTVVKIKMSDPNHAPFQKYTKVYQCTFGHIVYTE